MVEEPAKLVQSFIRTLPFGGSKLSLLRSLAYGSAVSTFILIVLGGYVSSTGSGNSCPDWPFCPQIVPPLREDIVIEYTHRVFALVVSAFVLATMLLAWARHRRNRGVLVFSTGSFLLLMGQIILGMVTVQSRLAPAVTTAHLAVASGVFALVLLNAVAVRNFETSARLERPTSLT